MTIQVLFQYGSIDLTCVSWPDVKHRGDDIFDVLSSSHYSCISSYKYVAMANVQ